MAKLLMSINPADIPDGGFVEATAITDDQWDVPVTYTFDTPVLLGKDFIGNPCVIADRSANLISITPASADLNGDGYFGNGAMKDPMIFYKGVGLEGEQGFDEYYNFLKDGSTSGYKETVHTPYNAALNVDPAVDGPIAITNGDNFSIVKQVRDEGKLSRDDGKWLCGKIFSTLSVLPAIPKQNFVRPSTNGTSKVIRSVDDVTFTPRGLTRVAGMVDYDTVMARVPPNIVDFHEDNEKQRYMRLDTKTNPAKVSTGYSGTIVETYTNMIYLLNTDELTDDQRRNIIARILINANDIEGRIERGAAVFGGAGQGGGRWQWIMAAACLLQDSSLHDLRLNNSMQPDTAFWIDQSKVGTFDFESSTVYGQPYMEEHIGMGHVEPDETSSDYGARYFVIAAWILAWENLGIIPFQQTPPGYTDGVDLIARGGPLDKTNKYAAIFSLIDRFYHMDPEAANTSYRASPEYKNMVNQIMALPEVTRFTHQAEQPPKNNQITRYFNAGGDGEVVLSVPAGYSYATEPVTSRDMCYSLDGRQWVTDLNIGALPHTKSGLLQGALHYCRWRHSSASGTSPWSQNYPFGTVSDGGEPPVQIPGPERDTVTTTGALLNQAPVFTTDPQIVVRRFENWRWSEYLPLDTGTYAYEQTRLYAGVGYYSGDPATSTVFSWTLNGVEVGTEDSINLADLDVAGNIGNVLALSVQHINATGNATASATNPLTLPAIPDDPAGIVIDTEFGDLHKIKYADHIDPYQSNNMGTTVGSTYDYTGEIEGVISAGAMRFRRTGAWASAYVNMGTLEAGASYQVTGQIMWNYPTAMYANATLRVGKESANSDYYTQSLPNIDGVTLSDLDFTINVAPGEADLSLSVGASWNSSTGGDSGGNLYIIELKVEKL